jgi:hypothetical protein
MERRPPCYWGNLPTHYLAALAAQLSEGSYLNTAPPIVTALQMAWQLQQKLALVTPSALQGNPGEG